MKKQPRPPTPSAVSHTGSDGPASTSPVDDHTTFDNHNWNDWEIGSNGASLQINTDISGNSYLHSTANHSIHGPMLQKTYANLQPQLTYVFTTRARAYDLTGHRLMLSIGQLLQQPRSGLLLDSGQWHSLGYAFRAPGPDVEMVVWGDHERGGAGSHDNIALDDLRLRLPLHDVTDFQPTHEDPFNAWQPGAAAMGGVLDVGPKGEAIYRLPTYGGSGNDGPILSKTIAVVPGFHYTFTVRAQASHASNTARLSLMADTTAICDVYQLTFSGQWETIEARWTAPPDSPGVAAFTLNSHRATGTGNDYWIDSLEIIETPAITY